MLCGSTVGLLGLSIWVAVVSRPRPLFFGGYLLVLSFQVFMAENEQQRGVGEEESKALGRLRTGVEIKLSNNPPNLNLDSEWFDVEVCFSRLRHCASSGYGCRYDRGRGILRQRW